MFQKQIFIISISGVHTLEDLALINRITGIFKLMYKWNSVNITTICFKMLFLIKFIGSCIWMQVPNPLELEEQQVTGQLMWMLGTDPRSSKRGGVGALSLWACLPAPTAECSSHPHGGNFSLQQTDSLAENHNLLKCRVVESSPSCYIICNITSAPTAQGWLSRKG